MAFAIISGPLSYAVNSGKLKVVQNEHVYGLNGFIYITKGERYEVICSPEAAIFIQKVAWVKLLWMGELLAIIQDRRQRREHRSALEPRKERGVMSPCLALLPKQGQHFIVVI